MRSDLKKRWVEALRSGEYRQVRGNLRSDCGYCAIGVLCDLYAKDKRKEWQYDDGLWFIIGYNMTLPDDVTTWAELTNSDIRCIGLNDDSVIELNDTWGFSFDKIASCIEESIDEN
jgi:hypothetical protein